MVESPLQTGSESDEGGSPSSPISSTQQLLRTNGGRSGGDGIGIPHPPHGSMTPFNRVWARITSASQTAFTYMPTPLHSEDVTGGERVDGRQRRHTLPRLERDARISKVSTHLNVLIKSDSRREPTPAEYYYNYLTLLLLAMCMSVHRARGVISRARAAVSSGSRSRLVHS